MDRRSDTEHHVFEVCGVRLRIDHPRSERAAVRSALHAGLPRSGGASGREAAVTLHVLSGGAPLPAELTHRDSRVEHATRGRATAAVGRGTLAVSFHGGTDHHILRRLIVIALLDRLALRGLRLIHAAAVAIDGGVVALLGASGAGKSTIAHALQRHRGFALTENYTLIDTGGHWHPFLDPLAAAPAVVQRCAGLPLAALVELVPTCFAAAPAVGAVERIERIDEHCISPQFRGVLPVVGTTDAARLEDGDRRFSARLRAVPAARAIFSHERSVASDTACAILAALPVGTA